MHSRELLKARMRCFRRSLGQVKLSAPIALREGLKASRACDKLATGQKREQSGLVQGHADKGATGWSMLISR